MILDKINQSRGQPSALGKGAQLKEVDDRFVRTITEDARSIHHNMPPRKNSFGRNQIIEEAPEAYFYFGWNISMPDLRPEPKIRIRGSRRRGPRIML